MSRDPLLKFRVRCSEDRESFGKDDAYEYFKTLEAATAWARKALKAGRFKRLVVQDMGGGYGHWSVLEELTVPKRQTSN